MLIDKIKVQNIKDTDAKNIYILKPYREETTKSEFLEMLEELDVTNLTDNEKDLFFSIVKNKYISDEEIMSLSYDQVKKMKELIIEKDKEGEEYIKASLISASLKANSLMTTSMISEDETFNKSVFNMIKDMPDGKEAVKLIGLLTGSTNVSDVVAWDEYIDDKNFDFQRIYDKDLTKFIENKIKYFEGQLEQELSTSERKIYEKVVSTFKTLKDYHETQKEEYTSSVNQVIKRNTPNILELLDVNKQKKSN